MAKPTLVLGIDIGTTFSGISFCIVEPNKDSTILPVTRFPAQEHTGSDCKIPSIIWYDRNGKARAFGAEAVQPSTMHRAQEENWQKVEWFKLHLRPGSMPFAANTIPDLPASVNITQVFTDFLGYLYTCARTYIIDLHPRGEAMWKSLEDSIQFVLTHPNGWEGEQQAKMRTAAVSARLVLATPSGRNRIHFVTEGEASLHFCIRKGSATGAVNGGKGVIIVDAGGGTVDISAYRKVQSSFQEISTTECLFEGSVFVTRHAKVYLRSYLANSPFRDSLDYICERFDATAKISFRNEDEASFIPFGRPSDRDASVNIAFGQLKLEGSVVKGFFQPSLHAIVGAIKNQRQHAGTLGVQLQSVLLVGGFAASEWLLSQLKAQMSGVGVEVYRPDSHVNKAVADGAVSYYLDHLVTARVAKYTFGTTVCWGFDASNEEHVKRKKDTWTDAAGVLRMNNGFHAILHQDVVVSETTEFKSIQLQPTAHKRRMLQDISLTVMRYRGSNKNPVWTDIEPESFERMCTIRADLSGVTCNLKKLYGKKGKYYALDTWVILSFGLTELKAQVLWIENGNEKRGPAEIIYSP